LVRVHSKFTRHVIHMGFDGEVHLKIARAAHDSSGYAVRVDRKRLHHRMRDKIATISMTRTWKIAGNVFLDSGVSAAIKNSFQFSRQQPAILFHSGPDGDNGSVAGIRRA